MKGTRTSPFHSDKVSRFVRGEALTNGATKQGAFEDILARSIWAGVYHAFAPETLYPGCERRTGSLE